jgi:hypothetical protein
VSVLQVGYYLHAEGGVSYGINSPNSNTVQGRESRGCLDCVSVLEQILQQPDRSNPDCSKGSRQMIGTILRPREDPLGF